MGVEYDAYSKVRSESFSNRRVEPTAEITSPKYSHFLCFSVKVRTNKFIQAPLERYTSQQEKIFNLIKSLKVSGLGYRKIYLTFFLKKL